MKKIRFIDLFCGCGGLSLGFEQAGFIPVAGIDFKESAIKTYREHLKIKSNMC
ncbi:DNA cytosine methyltransferase [Anaerocolumna sp. AGMB13025]|uniref:DNA cytosine methyltransferase n=1 Tax=Anaerocolumna sp. AGMB13025 TaxID=3039116 RepID=UPI00241F8A03|nr:DNA cytosine methyltransferase [Anaerocolumna sp. AGMB13025]WFR56847.1 DNA cytosine methyltransferase [Anaerocolumna sp. AGMB13025]